MHANHTPGPWFADSSFVGSHSIDRFFIKCNSKDLPNGVAEAEANARLIAAAPDLLAALRACVRAYDESVPVDQRWTTGTNLVPDWYAAARAAIARATEPTDDQFMAALGPCGK